MRITNDFQNKSSPLKSRPSKTPTTDSSSSATIPFLPPPPVSANNRVKRKNCMFYLKKVNCIINYALVCF